MEKYGLIYLIGETSTPDTPVGDHTTANIEIKILTEGWPLGAWNELSPAAREAHRDRSYLCAIATLQNKPEHRVPLSGWVLAAANITFTDRLGQTVRLADKVNPVCEIPFVLSDGAFRDQVYADARRERHQQLQRRANEFGLPLRLSLD